MDGGLFITLYDERTLSLYLKYGIYGFLMPPVLTPRPSSRSRHYHALADYACSREGTHIFFFLKRKIIYGGTVKGNTNIASFYLNGKTSPLGRTANAELFWDESIRYTPTDQDGIFVVRDNKRSQPFILQFNKISDLTGKQISSDDLYFELGKYPYPLPSNTIQGMSFCTLTPGETQTSLDLVRRSEKYFNVACNENMIIGVNQQLFESQFIDKNSYQNEAHLEFSLLADLERIRHLLPCDSYTLCRQVPISPFKPFNMDRADICLYSISNHIKNGTIPNVIIELKNKKANFRDYEQMVRYLNWLSRITEQEDFQKILPIIVAPEFNIRRNKIDLKYEDKIIMYSLNSGSNFVPV
jgi:hypothetical protein